MSGTFVPWTGSADQAESETGDEEGQSRKGADDEPRDGREFAFVPDESDGTYDERYRCTEKDQQPCKGRAGTRSASPTDEAQEVSQPGQEG